MLKKDEDYADERLLIENNRLAARMFYVMLLLVAVSHVVKHIFKLPEMVYVPEMLALVSGCAVVLVSELKKGILFVKKDEALLTIHEAVLGKALVLMTWIYLLGDVVLLFVLGEYFYWILIDFAVVMIPSLIMTVASVRNGWLIWGGKKRETEGKKKFKLRVAIGACVYGILMGWPELYYDGSFHIKGILLMLVMSAAFGVVFYAVFMMMMKYSEKRADKRLDDKEDDGTEL